MAYRARLLTPLRASLSSTSHSIPSLPLPGNLVSGRYQLFKVWPRRFEAGLPFRAPKFNSIFSMKRKYIQNWNPSGMRLLTQGFLGFSTVTAMTYRQSCLTYAMDDHCTDSREPSGFLRDDLHTFWALVKKFQLPAVLLITVLLGWRHPITLAINVALLLFCTRPSPVSVYIFIEQLRLHDMRQDPKLYKSKFFYAKKVEVEDYKILCLAKVELRNTKLNLIGILGGWWVVHSSQV